MRDAKHPGAQTSTMRPVGRGTRPIDITVNSPDESVMPIKALLDLAFAEQSEIQATRHFLRAMDQHDATSAGTFSTYFSSISFSKKHFHFWRLYFSSWGSFDAPAAIAYIKERFDQPALQKEFYFSVLKSWHRAHPSETLAAAGDLLMDNPGPEGELALDFLRELITKDPSKGLEYMVRLTDPEAVMEIAGLQLKSLSRTDLAGALAKLATTEGEAKNYLTGQLLSSWSETDPIATALWLTENGNPPISPGDLQAIASNYVRKDPVAAFEWISKLPDSLFNEELLYHSAGTWARVDPAGIKIWLDDHQPSAEADPVVASLARSLFKNAPAEAIIAVDKLIYDPAKSQETLYELAMEWQKEEPVAFERWLENTSLIEPVHKQRLLAHEFHGNAGNGARPPNPPQALNNGRPSE